MPSIGVSCGCRKGAVGRADLDEGQDGREVLHPLAHEIVREEFLLKDCPRDPHSSRREAAPDSITFGDPQGTTAGFKEQ